MQDIRQSMIAWFQDCTWQDLDPEEFETLSDTELKNGINRHYDGGYSQFLIDSEPIYNDVDETGNIAIALNTV